MSSIGEIMAEAQVVTHEQTVMYDHELLSEIKCLTVEELYVRLDKELDAIHDIRYSGSSDCARIMDTMIQNKKVDIIKLYLCELYRRNVIVTPIHPEQHECNRDPLWGFYSIHTHTGASINLIYWTCFRSYKKPVKDALTKLRKIRELQIACLKQPMLYEEINDLMDSILDCNGNKISEFKDYLTPDHYRLIRSGVDVKEIKEPDVLLECFRKMKSTRK